MKKIISVVLLMLLMILFACKKEEKVRVLLPSGTPLMSIGGLLTDERFAFEICNGQDPLSAALTSGDYDLIIAPLNLGAKLYMASSSSYKLEAIITTNNTYIMSKEPIIDINSLQDEIIVTYGTGSTPWIALKAALDINQVNVKEMISQNSASDVASLFLAETTKAKYFLAAEPNITNLREKKKIDIYTLDVSSLLENDVSVLIQACLFVNPTSYSSTVTKAIELIKDNINEMNTKPEVYANKIINKNDFFTTLGTTVILKAIPNSNITFLKASDNKKIIEEYYNLLNKYTKVLGNTVPDENFYN